jgi:hypothetical protein
VDSLEQFGHVFLGDAGIDDFELEDRSKSRLTTRVTLPPVGVNLTALLIFFNFMDSTCLKVCHNRRINQHKVFKDIAARGKTSVDWFFGLKLHLVINDKGELLNFQITPGNVDDRKPVPDLLQHLFVNILCGLIAYCHQPKKPGISMQHNLICSA